MNTDIRSAYHRDQLVIVLLVIGFVVFGWFLVKPTWGGLKAVKENLAETQTRLDEQKAVSQSIVKLLSNFDAQKSRLTVLDSALPDSPEVPQLLAGIEELAFISGMRIASLQITETLPAKQAVAADPANSVPVEKNLIKPPELVNLKIDLSLTGSPENFYNFISVLELNLRLLDVTAVNIDSATEGSLFDLSIDTFYRK